MYSLQTRMKALAIAGVMAASVAGSTMSAFAAVSTEKQLNSVSITKNVYYPAQGVTPQMPAGVKSFGFTATFESSSLPQKNGSADRGTAPQTFTATVTPDSSWTGAENGTWSSTETLTVTGENDNAFSWDNVTPGEYVYTLTENGMTVNGKTTYEAKDDYGYGWTFNKDNTSYKLRVYVSNNTGADKATNPKTVKYTLINTADESGKTAGTDAYNGHKVATASFSNIYTVRGGSKTPGEEEDPALTVSKTANGEYDDQTKAFDFYISFTYPTVAGTEVKPMSGDNSAVDGIVAKAGDGYVSQFTKVTESNRLGDYKFSLKNGEKIAFVNLPAGTTYTITEAADSQYSVAGFNYKENGATTATEVNTSKWQSVKSGQAFVAKVTENRERTNFLIGEKHNEINFTNTRDSITITGVVTHSAPFVIMVGALFVAVGGYVVLKKRIEE